MKLNINHSRDLGAVEFGSRIANSGPMINITGLINGILGSGGTNMSPKIFLLL